MVYMKHPVLGNKHVGEEEAAGREAEGWTRFPRSKEAKALGAWPPVPNAAPQEKQKAVLVSAVEPSAPDGAAPETLECVRAQLDALGIEYDGRLGLAKLQALLPQG